MKTKIIFEVLKAILYAVAGVFGCSLVGCQFINI